MTMDNAGRGATRRKVLQCMAWGSAGIIWTVAGGVPRARALDQAGPEMLAEAGAFSFVQISDTHIGFNKEANPDVSGTLTQSIDMVNALREQKLLTVGAGDNVVRFLAPLIVTETEIDQSISSLERACAALASVKQAAAQ